MSSASRARYAPGCRLRRGLVALGVASILCSSWSVAAIVFDEAPSRSNATIAGGVLRSVGGGLAQLPSGGYAASIAEITIDTTVSDAVTSVEGLRAISFVGCRVNGNAFAKICERCPDLEIIRLDNSSLAENVLSGIGVLESLQGVSLAGCRVHPRRRAITDADLEPLRALAQLKSLDLLGASVTGETLSDMPSLRALRVGGIASGVGAAGLEMISRLDDLEELDIGVREGCGAIGKLARLTRLRSLSINTSCVLTGDAFGEEGRPGVLATLVSDLKGGV